MGNKNENLHKAKQAKNDEFYTQYEDIQTEMNAYYEYNNDVFRDKVILCPCDDPEWSNFTKFFIANFQFYGLKKLICTSYADSSKNFPDSHVYQPSLFETESEQFDPDKSATHGKVFILDRDQMKKDGTFKQKDLQWTYLEGDGDFRSDEVTKLRDEADIIVTNPAFSLFRPFMAWVEPTKRKFCVIGNMNAITYKEIFPLIKNNIIWTGFCFNKTMEFIMPDDYELKGKAYIDDQGRKHGFVPGICWFTNLDHGKRHEPMKLMTMTDNIKYSRHQSVRGGYKRYDNYDAIEVPFTDAIPSDCDEVIGCPISMLDKYCPEQFQIIGLLNSSDDEMAGISQHKTYEIFKEIRQDGVYTGASGKKTNGNPVLSGKPQKGNFYVNESGETVYSTYARILVRKYSELKFNEWFNKIQSCPTGDILYMFNKILRETDTDEDRLSMITETLGLPDFLGHMEKFNNKPYARFVGWMKSYMMPYLYDPLDEETVTVDELWDARNKLTHEKSLGHEWSIANPMFGETVNEEGYLRNNLYSICKEISRTACGWYLTHHDAVKVEDYHIEKSLIDKRDLSLMCVKEFAHEYFQRNLTKHDEVILL